MVGGVSGHCGLNVARLVMGVCKKDPENATTHHQRMGGHHAVAMIQNPENVAQVSAQVSCFSFSFFSTKHILRSKILQLCY